MTSIHEYNDGLDDALGQELGLPLELDLGLGERRLVFRLYLASQHNQFAKFALFGNHGSNRTHRRGLCRCFLSATRKKDGECRYEQRCTMRAATCFH